jgi:hypothetical protein
MRGDRARRTEEILAEGPDAVEPCPERRQELDLDGIPAEHEDVGLGRRARHQPARVMARPGLSRNGGR